DRLRSRGESYVAIYKKIKMKGMFLLIAPDVKQPELGAEDEKNKRDSAGNRARRGKS
ncbi:hypothetical protein A2U01_0053820, partial [Trifolium medium]|nr:hypothetical protein [Trifolium medium]